MKLIPLSLGIMLLTAFSLSANTLVNVTYLGDPYGIAAPYDLTVGTLQDVLGMCISGTGVYIYTNPWQANEEPVTDYSNTTTPPETLTQAQLNQMAWLYGQFQLPVPASDATTTQLNTDAAIGQAIWYIAGVSGGSNSIWVTDAVDAVAAMNASQVSSLESEFEVLVPTLPQSQNPDQGSQVFLIPSTPAATPEPSPLTLVAIALLGLGILCRRRAFR